MAIDLPIDEIAHGALAERLYEELEKAVANILDINTDPEKPRKVKIELTIKANKKRSMAHMTINTSASLVSAQPLATEVFIGRDFKTGEIGISEIDPLQRDLPFTDPETYDRAKELDKKFGTNVMNFNKDDQEERKVQ